MTTVVPIRPCMSLRFRAARAFSSADAERARRIEELRVAVSSGRYRIPARWLARRILSRAGFQG